ncbi:hypothetical protein [Enterococcus sp. AZ072]|uniref:hypothetical protein n=1 Tax=unclassified Enterococcus TaxID=2608891 RepID=UPI003D2E7161
MTTTELHKRTIFGTRNRNNLELKFADFYTQTKNVSHLIQAAVAVMLRNAFYTGDFSYLAKDLMRKVFLNGEVDASVRHLCIYFEDYFSSKEWQIVINHLYKNEAEYNQLTAEARLHIEPLRPALTSGVQIGERKLNLKTSFLDENGKMHNWNLSNVVSPLSAKERMAILNIFGELTIFQKDGLRQFTKVVWMDFAIDERYRDFDIRNEEDPLHEPKQVIQEQQKKDTKAKLSTKNTASNSKASEITKVSKSNTFSPAKETDKKNEATKSKKKPVKPPMDRMSSWKNFNPFDGKSKEDRNLELEKALRNKTGGKKKRKRNKRK